MRRLGAFIVAVVCLVTCFSFATVAQAEETQYDYYLDTVEGLGLFVKTGDLELESGLYLTRGEFMDLVANLLGVAEVNTGYLESPFADVEGDHASLKNLITLTDMGYINGDEYGNANLDSPITEMQALKVLVRMAGYGDLAMLSGGYPLGYKKYANDLKLTRGITVNDEEPATYGVLARMVYNLFDVRILKISGMGDNGDITYTAGDTVLYEYKKIKKGSGIVDQNAISGISSADAAGEGRISVDGTMYNCDKYSENLGYNVDFYYDEDNNIVYMSKIPNKNVVTVIEVEDFKSFEGNTLQYYDENDKLETIKNVGAFDVILNGRHSVNWVEPLKNLKEGKITVLDNNDDDEDDLMFIESYRTVVVDAVDKDKDIAYGKYNVDAIKMKEGYDEDNLTIIGADGAEITFDQLKEWDILSASMAEDTGSGIIYVSNTMVSGTITSKNTADKKVSIDDVVYELEDNFYNQNFSLIKIGDNATFYLNRFGKLAAKYTGRNTIFQYGYLVDTTSFPNFMDTVVQLKIFTEAGELKVFDLHEKVTVDGTTGVKNTDVLGKLPKNKSEGYQQVIIYKTNSEGKINYIDTKEMNREAEDINTLWPMYTEGGSLGFKTGIMAFNDKFHLDDKAVVFIVPADTVIETADARDFSIANSGYFRDYTNYYPEAYAIGDTYKAQIVVLRTSTANASLSTSDTLSVVTDVAEVLVEDELTTEYTILKDGAEVKVVVDPEYTGEMAEKGDLVRYKVNRFGYLDLIELAYDYSAKKYMLSNPYGSYDPVIKFLVPHSRRDNIIKASMIDPKDVKEEKEYSYYHVSDAPIYRVEDAPNGEPQVRAVSASDIMTYENSKSADERILLYIRDTRVRAVFIVNTAVTE